MPQLAHALHGMGNRILQQTPPAQIRAFDQEISAVPELVKLTLGEPGFDVPTHIKQAAIQSIHDNDSHYAAAAGKLPLRQAIATNLKQRYGVDYQPDGEVVVTNGATEALTASLLSLLNPGDKVIIPTPGYALYQPLVAYTGAQPVEVNTRADGFVLTPEKLAAVIEANAPVKALLLNFPVNPTGRTYQQAELAALAAVAKQYHLLVLADEIYGDLTYDHRHYSMVEALPEQTVLISGLSKSHAMTGWRIGYLAGPAALVQQIAKMHSFLVTCINDTAQAAALEAIENGQDDPVKFRQEYEHRRNLMIEALTAAGFEMATPEGAFYLFAKIPAQYGDDDFAFARVLAKQARVGVIPGSVFGPGGEGYVRLSSAADEADIKVAMARIQAFMAAQN